MAPQRKSGRQRQSSKKYTVDAFEGLDIPHEIDDGSPAPQLPEDDGDDAEFRADANPSPEPAEDEYSNAGDVEPEDLGDQVYGNDEDEDSDVIASDTEGPKFRSGSRKNPEYGRSKGSRLTADPRFQPRGLLEPATRGSKEVQRLFMFGPTPQDQTPPLQGHYKWSAEPTLPSRKSTKEGFGGFTRSFFFNEAAIKREANEGWEWYEVEGGKESFQARQISSTLHPDEAQTYLPATSTPPLSIVMGPYKEQRMYSFHVGSITNLNDAWVPGGNPDAMSDAPPPVQDPRTLRNGWLINLGQRVSSLDWLPNQKGSRQFLAVSTSPGTDVSSKEVPFQSSTAPAFTTQAPFKSAIQIWEFTSRSDGHVDTSKRPTLRKVICTSWSEVKSIKWCPAPRVYDTSQTETLNLGLLASLWGDGAFRILDVSIPASSDVACEHVYIHHAAFVVRPPNTLCTCFTWLSSTGVAVGSANGTLGVWHIPSSVSSAPPPSTSTESRPSSASSAEPIMFASLSTTYILGIVSCYPSRPQMLLATTMAGHLLMIDLMDMSSNTSLSPAMTIRSTRTRIGRTNLVWHDWSQMALSADDNFTLVAYPLRRFFRQVGCTRYKSPPMDLAISPVHPFVLAGCAGGEAVSHNPLRRAYESKVPIWNQTWFRHEWRPTTPDEDKGIMWPRPTSGICRVLEGLKCEFVRLFNTEDSFTHRENGTIYTTVHELNTTVTAVGWNPNIHVGGWAAAGTASGLLRVEDIAS